VPYVTTVFIHELIMMWWEQVEFAVRNGYRHLDLAMCYENQDEVGAALKKVIGPVVKREELFITSKLWNTAHKAELVEKELDETLKQLGLDYLDMYRTCGRFLCAA
jgi:L-glyceraldehyde reductase